VIDSGRQWARVVAAAAVARQGAPGGGSGARARSRGRRVGQVERAERERALSPAATVTFQLRPEPARAERESRY
jgi:hypothetical protein